MPTISDRQVDLNRDLHECDAAFGSSGYRWVILVWELHRTVGGGRILDYGAGKGTLARAFKRSVNVRNYDPAVPKWDDSPEPAAIVVCTDVLEHVEPDHLEETLAHLRSLTVKAGFFNISTDRPDHGKLLADGADVHSIRESAEWWIERFQQHDFYIEDYVVETKYPKVFFIATPGSEAHIGLRDQPLRYVASGRLVRVSRSLDGDLPSR